jgi:hypothetical protein
VVLPRRQGTHHRDRIFGISRKTYYEWEKAADRYRLDALVPKARRKPQMPEATPTYVLEALLSLAVTQPTIGCRQYADRLGDQWFSIGKSTAQEHLVTHGLGKWAVLLHLLHLRVHAARSSAT